MELEDYFESRTCTSLFSSRPWSSSIPADAHGNNVAILCPSFSVRPLLLVAREHMRGSNHDRPSRCGCGARVWITSPLVGVVPEVRIAFESGATVLGRTLGD